MDSESEVDSEWSGSTVPDLLLLSDLRQRRQLQLQLHNQGAILTTIQLTLARLEVAIVALSLLVLTLLLWALHLAHG